MEINMKKILVSLTVASMLSACGGSSSGDSVQAPIDSKITPTPIAVEYRVIDGYLSAADVCLIATGEANCESIGKTDENGSISVASDITAGQIVATVVAGQTKDADGVGFVGRSYQMVATISSDTPNVVTPFTTLVSLDATKSMADIAASLNLPESLLSGDYVASEDVKKSQVHALARGLATLLSGNKDDNDLSNLVEQVAAINEYITTELANNNVDLNTVNFIINGNTVTHNKAITKLSDFLESGDVYVGSINSAFFAMEGVRPASFSNGQMTMNGFTTSYEIDGDKLIMTVDGGKEADRFIYTSADLTLSVPLKEKDLTVMSHNLFGDSVDFELTNTWDETDFIGKTYYLVFDDASSMDQTPVPVIVSFSFSQSTVKITEGDSSVESPWKIFLGMLNIDMLEAGVGERNFVFAKSISDNNITLVRDLKDGRAPSLLFKEESLARAVYAKWKGI
jgi:hypothetical protein